MYAYGKIWILNPPILGFKILSQKKKVHVFANVSHLLKLAWNHFINKCLDLRETYVGCYLF